VKCGSDLRPVVTELQPVQCIAGNGPPFRRLADLLAGRQFSAAAIDAPFSLPSRYVPTEGWLRLLQLVDALSVDADMPFPRAQSLIVLAQTTSHLESQKPLRLTEKLWSDRRINVRSTLWWKPRGGAPFAAACMKLLATARFPPCWPRSTEIEGLVVEAFPAAQLWSWKLPLQKYDGRDGISARQEIIRGLESRINLGRFRKAAEETATAPPDQWASSRSPSISNAAGVRTRDGGRWGIGAVHKVLTRMTYIGRHRFNTRFWKTRERKPEMEVVEMTVPPTIDAAQF
jgi:hypothetical protein